jgi:putative membrane protein
VTKAAEGGMFEVEVGKLAKDKGSDQAVKDFGQKLVDDHSAANDKLKSIASSHNEPLPASLPADKQKELDRLAKLSGAAFDKEFIQMVGMKDHKTDIALFEKASREAKSDDLRDFAKSTLPTLHQHLSTAEKLPAHKHG